MSNENEEIKKLRAFFSKGIQCGKLVLVKDDEHILVYIGHKDDDPHENEYAFALHVDYCRDLLLALKIFNQNQSMKSDFLTPRTQQDLRETVDTFLSMKSVGITEARLTSLCQREGKFEHEITAETIAAVMQDFRREILEHKAENPHLYPNK